MIELFTTEMENYRVYVHVYPRSISIRLSDNQGCHIGEIGIGSSISGRSFGFYIHNSVKQENLVSYLTGEKENADDGAMANR